MIRSRGTARVAARSAKPAHRGAAAARRKPRRAPAGAAANEAIDWRGVHLETVTCEPATVLFSQGDVASSVMFVETGNIRLSVVSHGGKEAVIAVLEAQSFFGEGCLAGQPRRMSTATASTPCTILTIDKQEMSRQLLEQPALADRFLSHMLTRNIRIEEDLVDQLFNSSEKRLARTLLLLARYGDDGPERVMPKVSQELLAEMIGTTRSRVNFFMNKFRKLGFIEYSGGGFTIHSSLLSVVLHE